MIYFVAPLFLSYATYIFFAEQFNPLKTAREVSVRRRARRGRRIALATLPPAYAVAFTMYQISSQSSF